MAQYLARNSWHVKDLAPKLHASFFVCSAELAPASCTLRISYTGKISQCLDMPCPHDPSMADAVGQLLARNELLSRIGSQGLWIAFGKGLKSFHKEGIQGCQKRQ